MERLNHLTTYGHVALAYTLCKEAEVEPFPVQRIGKTEGIAWEGITENVTVFRVYDAIGIAIDELEVARFHARAYGNGCCLNLLVVLEEAVGLVTIVRCERHTHSVRS